MGFSRYCDDPNVHAYEYQDKQSLLTFHAKESQSLIMLKDKVSASR